MCKAPGTCCIPIYLCPRRLPVWPCPSDRRPLFVMKNSRRPGRTRVPWGRLLCALAALCVALEVGRAVFELSAGLPAPPPATPALLPSPFLSNPGALVPRAPLDLPLELARHVVWSGPRLGGVCLAPGNAPCAALPQRCADGAAGVRGSCAAWVLAPPAMADLPPRRNDAAAPPGPCCPAANATAAPDLCAAREVSTKCAQSDAAAAPGCRPDAVLLVLACPPSLRE